MPVESRSRSRSRIDTNGMPSGRHGPGTGISTDRSDKVSTAFGRQYSVTYHLSRTKASAFHTHHLRYHNLGQVLQS